MPEEQEGGKKILGMKRKTAIWVIGGAVAFVLVVLWMRARSAAPAEPGAIPVPPPQFPGGGGGGGGFMFADQAGLEQANLALNEQRTAARQREALGELELREREARVGAVESGARLERQYGEATLPALIGARREEFRARGAELAARAAEFGFQRQAAETARVSEERFTAEAGRAPIKCPPGMHPSNVPGVGLTCRQLGDPGGGRGFQPFRQIGQIFGGLLGGVAQAAPAIGGAAAFYGASQAGVIPPIGGGSRQQRQPVTSGEWERIGTRSGVMVNEPITGPSYSQFTTSYPGDRAR